MAKPDKPGEWHSRDGRVVFVWGDLSVTRMDANCHPIGTCDLRNIEGDDWLPAIAPTFPKLPPKPFLVFAKTKYHGPCWWMVENNRDAISHETDLCAGYSAHVKDLCLVGNNDPEAVRLIEEAKRATS